MSFATGHVMYSNNKFKLCTLYSLNKPFLFALRLNLEIHIRILFNIFTAKICTILSWMLKSIIVNFTDFQEVTLSTYIKLTQLIESVAILGYFIQFLYPLKVCECLAIANFITITNIINWLKLLQSAMLLIIASSLCMIQYLIS